MISIRQARFEDLIQMQQLNVKCLPENYTFKFFYYHFISWPELIFVAENIETNSVVGYVMGKIEDNNDNQNKGHVTSLAVHRNFRKLGIAHNLMKQLHIQLS